MTFQKQLNDLNIGAIGDQLGDQFSNQADNLKSTLRDVAQTAQSKNPLPLSKKEKKSVSDTLLAFGFASVLLFLAFLFYRAIVKAGVKAALREHDEEVASEWAYRHDQYDHADQEIAEDDYQDDEDDEDDQDD